MFTGCATRPPPGTSSLDEQAAMPAKPAHDTSPTKRFFQRLRSICMVMAPCTPAHRDVLRTDFEHIPFRIPERRLSDIGRITAGDLKEAIGVLLGEWRARERCTSEHRLHPGRGNTRHRGDAGGSHTPRPTCKTCSGHQHRPRPGIACPFHIAGHVVRHMSRSRRNDRGRKTHRRTRDRTSTLAWVRSSTKVAQDNHPRWPCPPARASSLDLAHKFRSSIRGASKPPAAASPTPTKDAVHCRSKVAALRSLAIRWCLDSLSQDARHDPLQAHRRSMNRRRCPQDPPTKQAPRRGFSNAYDPFAWSQLARLRPFSRQFPIWLFLPPPSRLGIGGIYCWEPGDHHESSARASTDVIPVGGTLDLGGLQKAHTLRV